MRDTEKQPTCKVVARRKGYALYENGELWRTGSYPYLAVCVEMPVEKHIESAILKDLEAEGWSLEESIALDCAIDTHEEEMRCLEAEDWFEQSWLRSEEY